MKRNSGHFGHTEKNCFFVFTHYVFRALDQVCHKKKKNDKLIEAEKTPQECWKQRNGRSGDRQEMEVNAKNKKKLAGDWHVKKSLEVESATFLTNRRRTRLQAGGLWNALRERKTWLFLQLTLNFFSGRHKKVLTWNVLNLKKPWTIKSPWKPILT